LVVPLRVKHRITIEILLLDKYPKDQKRDPNGYAYMNVHSSTIYNSQKAETIQMSFQIDE
jgi:hypothetical protein